MSSRVYASIIFLLVCSSLLANGYVTIFINNNGYDKESCITDSQEELTPCKTLHYVLNELSLTQLETKDVTVIVENSQTIQSINISYGFELNVTVLGVGQPSLSCEDNGYLHFSSEDNINVDITFDGITFKNFNRHELHNDEWITGYAFLNFNMVTLRNVIVTNSSDIFFTGNILVSIENCWFHDNVYRFGLVYISLTDNTKVMSNDTSTISYTITYSNFNDNIALLGNHSQFVAVIGGIVTTTKQDLSIYFHISNCLFENDQSLNQDLNFENTELAEIVLNVTSASLDNLGIKIQESMFTNQSSSIIQVTCQRSSYNTFSSNIISNTFFNNVAGGGEIVAFSLQDVSSLLLTEILYETNNASYNIGDGLRVFFSNVSSPKMVTIRNSTFVKNYGKAIRASCVHCSMHVATFNLSFIEASENKVLNLQTGVVDITRSTVYMANSTFSDNVGTAVYVKDVNFYVDGQILFERNAGTYGGGLTMIGNTQFFVRNSALMFVDNLALYGGGIYNGIITYEGQVCTAVIIENCDVHFTFVNNTASSSGNNAFFVDSALAGCIGEFIYGCFHVNITEIGYGSSAVAIKGIYGNSGADTLTMFPGQNLIINSTVYDAFFRLGSCEAAVYLQCEKQVITCRNDGQFIQLDGPTLITIGSLTYTSNIKLLASKNISNSTFNNPSLRFKCSYTQTYTLYLDIIDCPVGFVYNETTSACQCDLQNSKPFYCSLPHGIVCVEEGFWLGNIKGDNGENMSIVSKCRFGTYCNNINTIPCPNIAADQRGVSTDSYVLVGLSEDDQCNGNRGGILCSYCREGATFSYEGLLCISNDKCKPWHPYALLTLAILFQLILAYVIQLFLSSHTALPHGIGFLFGPLFYLAVVDNLFYIYYVDFYSLRLLISIFTSVFHLNLEIFGQINWCFFSTLNPLENYAFHYLGPLMVSVIVTVTILLSRKCPKLQKYLYISPIQTICLLFLMSFWSLNNIFSHVFEGVEFPGSKHKQVAVHPELRYFTGSHIPLTIISGFLCICGAFPFILVLLLAPFISKKISLYRIQPFLDQFQSSYKDNFRWYPSVYMIGWIIILVLRRQPLITQIVLTIMLLAFIIFRPYSTKWLNIANGLLLLDSVTVVGLLNSEEHLTSDDYVWIWVNPLVNTLIHLLTILPLLYIVCGTMWIVTMRFKIDYYLKNKFWPKQFRSFRKKSRRSLKNLKQLSNRRKISHQDVTLSNDSNEFFREPLMDVERTIEESSIDNYESDYTHIIA